MNERIAAYVLRLESEGHQVHWPKRDTKQDGDPIGIRICRDNREAMFTSDEVHVWYDPDSRGSCFDLGMATMFRVSKIRPVVVVNQHDILLVPPAPQLSLLLRLGHQSIEPELRERLEDLRARCDLDALGIHATRRGDTEIFNTYPDDVGALCVYGVIFADMRSNPRKIVLGIAITPTPEKSFANLLLFLAEETKDGPKVV